jgi:hypothetical protein
MLRLTIDGNEIELYENEPVNLSYQFSNLQEINASSSNFSQTFRVPLTKKNQDYFGPVNEFGLIPDWDPKTKVDAELSYNTIPVMRGFVQVKAVYVQKGKYADVELVFFGETANLSRDIGDAMLTDLNLSAYDHDLNATNLAASWAGTLSSGVIRYGLPDKGKNWTSANIWTSSDPLEHGDFTPYFRISKLFETILREAGYTYDSDFFDNEDDLYLMLYNGLFTPASNDDTDFSADQILVGLSSNLTGLTAHPNFTSITAWSESSPFYDQNNRFTSGTTYTVPYRAYYRFRVNVYGRLDHDTGDFVSMRLSRNGSELWTFIDNFESPEFNDITHALLSPEFVMEAGDTVEFQYVVGNSSHPLALDGGTEVSNLTTWWQVAYISTIGLDINVTQNLPEIKQIDFVSGLQKMFNLVFIPDRNNAKHLYIEPFNDYLAAGTKKDWTNKIDLSKDITIEPTTDLQSRRYDWTHSNGKDVLNEAVFKSTSRVYGRYRVDDPQNDFASGTKEIKSPFAPHVVSRIPQTGYLVHRMLLNTTETDKSLKKPLPRLAYWNGLIDGDLFYQNDTNTSAVSATEYPVFSQYSVLNANVSNDDLSYGAERPFHIIQASPLNTLYYKYWRPYVNQLYSSDARKLTAFFRLTKAELATFEFSDKIYLKDTYWRILSISYDATSEDIAKVELLKVLSDIRDCALIPYDINKANGKIRFTNAAGTVVDQVSPANSICCTKYGYVYDSDNSACYQPFEQ